MGVYIPGENWTTQGPVSDRFHVPLSSEWTTIDGILRYTFGLGLERDYTTECLKMPYAGQRQYETSNTRFQGSLGFYRCADGAKVYETDEEARPTVWTDVSSMGFSIRPFKNAPVTPDSSRTVLYQGTGSAGVYHNSTLGLISISGDGTTRYTIADKNLGATQVWNSGDTASEANCGKYYQRGNNYGFPRSGSVTTSSSQVDASSYGPGNYYSSSTFIIGSGRDSSGNGNLWGGVDGNVSIMSELKNAYIGEYHEGWQPGANTIAYFPLKEDAVDIKNNISLTSYGTTNYTTVGGVKSAEFTKSNWLYNNNVSYVPQGDVAKTFSLWLYTKGSNSSWQGIAQIGRDLTGTVFGLGAYQGRTDIIMTRHGSVSNTYTPTLNTWTHIVATYNNSMWKMYANGNLVVTWNATAPVSGYNLYIGQNVEAAGGLGATYYGNISNVILELGEWTSEQVADYYNSTKSDYGL